MERDAILTKLRERILRFAASRIARDAAEDVAQEVLLVLYEKYSHLDRIDDLLPVSLEIARYKMMAAHRKVYRRGEHKQVPVEDLSLASGDIGPFDQASRRESLDRLEKALTDLGDRCREIFRLKLQGLTFPEIQKRMNAASVNTIYTWDFRCRKKLLDRLGGAWIDPKEHGA